MKVTAFIGSGRKRHSYNACEKFLQNLQTLGNVEYELVRLSEYNISTCRGCRICFDKGEEFCPLKDDRYKLMAKMKDYGLNLITFMIYGGFDPGKIQD